jgi:CDP-glucose 4,6-dehydratase
MYGGGDLNWNRVVPGTIRSVLRGQRPVVRSDGTPRRDYLFVMDIVHAYLTLAEAMDGGQQAGEAFNFGMDSPKTVLEMVRTIIDQSGRADLEPLILGEAPNEIRDQYLSSEKARRVLGWHSKYSLEMGLRETIAWYREFLGV